MLNLLLQKGQLLHDVLEASLDLSDVALVECSTEGLNLQAVDTEGFAIFELFLPAENLPDYFCDEYISMGIPIGLLVNAMRCSDDTDVITLKVDKENFDTFTLSFVSPDTNTVEYIVRRLAHDGRLELLDWEDLGSKYHCSVEMPSVMFRQICKYIAKFGKEDVVISVTDKVLKLSTFGTSGNAYIEYKQSEEDPNTIKIDMQEPTELYLDRKYLNTLVKFYNLSGQVKLSLSKTHPLMVQYKIGQKGHIKCFVAQKMETESQGGEEEKEAQDTDANYRIKLTDD